MKTTYKISGLLAAMTLLTSFVSCNKFLEEKPSKGTGVIITNTSDLTALLNNYSSFYSEINRTALYSSDDYGLTKSLFDGSPSRFPLETVRFSTWDIVSIPGDFAEVFWSNEYAKIFRANLVLYNVDNLSGAEQEKATLKADAYFIRAYSYFQLVNTYCLPYSDANKNEPGLPLKLRPDYEETLVRKTLEQTYQQIESDLNEALKTTVPLVQNGVARHWRASTAGVNGFASRYYLAKGDYDKALQYANASLAEYSQLVNYNTDMRYGISSTVTVNGQPVAVKFPYTHDKSGDFNDMLGWKEFLYFRMLNFNNATNAWYLPSQQLLSLYDTTNDLRYKYHMVKNYSYYKGATSYSYPGYVFFYDDRVPSGPTVAEMYLIKAEALARTGDVAAAMTAINILHRARTVPGSPDLVAASQDLAIKTILEERRREVPFSQRWFDIRRFNNNNYSNDDVPALSRTFYPYTASSVTTTAPVQVYTLPASSRRFAQPVPLSEITNSNGEIIQNNY